LGELRASAERLLEDHLITADGTRTLRTEKELLRVLPAKELSPVLKALEGAAVLHAEEHQGSRYFEIGHDWLARRVHEERERKRREKEQQEALVTAQAEAEATLALEQRKRKSLRMITAASLVGLAVSGALGGMALYGYWKATEAEEQAKIERDK